MSRIDFKSSTKPPVLDLDALLSTDLSDTKISDTKGDGISDTKQSEISDTKVSATKISDTKYMNDYKREKYDTLRIDVPKGTKEVLKREAAKRGISLQRMVKDALKLYLGGKS